MKKSKVGIVLSGGGAKGAYEVGFLKYLAKRNIVADAVAGTSIGALNGTMLSAKKNISLTVSLLEDLWEELGELTNSEFLDRRKKAALYLNVISFFTPLGKISKLAKLLNFARAGSSKEGVLSQAPILNRLNKYAPIEDILDGLPFYIGLTESRGQIIDLANLFGANFSDVEYKNVQAIEREQIYTAITASAALPIVFDALEVDKKHYRDGCLGDTANRWGNTPAKPLVEKEGCTHLIICHLEEGSPFDRNDPVFKDVSIIEVRPTAGTFSCFTDPGKFSAHEISNWMAQGYEDTKRIVGDALDALQVVNESYDSERVADGAIGRLKSRPKFELQ